jgi:hypothetical protein
MLHECKPKLIRCRFSWGSPTSNNIWCNKVLRCEKCKTKILYKLICDPVNCKYFEKHKFLFWKNANAFNIKHYNYLNW